MISVYLFTASVECLLFDFGVPFKYSVKQALNDKYILYLFATRTNPNTSLTIESMMNSQLFLGLWVERIIQIGEGAVGVDKEVSRCHTPSKSD